MNSENKPQRKPYGLLAGLLVIWGSFAAVNKLALNSLDVFQVLFFQFGIAFAALFIWMLAAKKLPNLHGLGLRRWIWLILLGVLSFLYYFLYSTSLSLIAPVDASCINYLFPVLITLLAVPINGEKMTVAKGVSILLGFAGMVIIVTGGDFSKLRLNNIGGILCALAGSFCWALFSTLGKNNLTDIISSNFVYAGIGWGISCVLLVSFSGFAVPPSAALAALAWNGIMNFCISYYLWFRALKTASASFVASVSFITPFVTIAFLAVLLGEPVTWANIAGLAVILFGVAAQNLLPRKRQMAAAAHDISQKN